MSKLKVEVNPQPEAKAAPASDGSVIVTDAKGRTLKVKPLDVLYESRLTRAIGSESAMNAAYMLGFVFPAASVVEIDGEEVPQPNTQRELDASIQRLGREGIAAVMQHLQAQFASTEETEAAIKN